MDSEVDLSLLAPLTTCDSIKIGSKNLRRGRSAHTTWVYTHTARDGEDSRHKFCIYCIVILLYSTSVSTNMRGHLELKHRIYVDRTPGPI